MDQRKRAFLGLMVIIVICSFCLLFFILTYFKPPAEPPVSAPVSGPVSFPVSFPQEPEEITDPTDYRFAVITPSDTIQLKNQLNSTVDLNIDHKKWKDLKWSYLNDYLAVLGEVKEGVFDIFIYNVETKDWRNATNFQSQPAGVSSYFWGDNDQVFFMQGESGNRWLHKYSYASNSVQKLGRFDGEVLKSTKNMHVILAYEQVSSQRVYSFLDQTATVLYKLDQITEISGKNPLFIYFLSDSTKVVLDMGSSAFYLHTIGETKATLLENIKVFNSLCMTRADNLLGYFYSESLKSLELQGTRLESNTKKIYGETVFEGSSISINLEKSSCFGMERMILSINSDSENIWVTNLDGEVASAEFLEGAKEAVGKN